MDGKGQQPTNPFEISLPKSDLTSGIEKKLEELQQSFEEGYAKLAESYGLAEAAQEKPKQ